MKKIITLLLLLPLCFCTPKSKTLTDLDWIIGTRSMQQGDQTIYESWTKTNNELFSGKSFFITNNDTTILETIEIKVIDNEIYYCPSVVNQNDGKPVQFKLTSTQPDKLVFENSEHDFPKKICYNKDASNIDAWIEGDDKKIPFYMKGVNP